MADKPAGSELHRNPQDLPLVTLDNNAFIALRGNESTAPAVGDLIKLNSAGLICINVTVSTALEAQRPDELVEWQDHFIAWLESLGIRRSNIFTGPRSVGFSTP